MDYVEHFHQEAQAFVAAVRAVTLAGTASDLMLFLWHRVPPEALGMHGDAGLVSRYFDLVPPV